MTKRRVGLRGTKLNQEAVEFLLSSIEDHPDLTLAEMQTLLLQQKSLEISKSTIARKLEGQLIALKKMELVPERRNSLENKDSRKRHAEWLQREHEQGARFCYVDECGYGMYTARTRGKSVRRLPAKRVADNQRTPNITLMCAICPGLGVTHSTTIVGGARQDQFDQFVRSLFECDFGKPMVPGHGRNRYIVFDNAPCHRGVKARVSEDMPEDCNLFVFLPAAAPSIRSRTAFRV